MKNLFGMGGSLVAGLVVGLALLLGAPAAMASELDNAQAAGLVGEKRDGYLGVVSSGAGVDIQRLVSDVNLRRRDHYKAIADATAGTTLAEVETLAGTKLIAVTPTGEYVQDGAGAWVRK